MCAAQITATRGEVRIWRHGVTVVVVFVAVVALGLEVVMADSIGVELVGLREGVVEGEDWFVTLTDASSSIL